MHNLLRCRRGTVAFVTVVALVPLIGVVVLGGEAGSWYVTKQHAQNAADAAAYSGGLWLACSISKSSTCDQAQDYVYRGKQFADQNSFCDPRDKSSSYVCANSPPTGTTQTVQIDQPTSSRVRAIVSQQQPTYLAKLFGLSTVNIPAQAVAQVDSLPTPACALALTGSVSFQGSPNITAPGCTIASNDTATDALTFTGGGMTINLGSGSLSAAGGCTGSSTFCDASYVRKYMPPVTNPFSALDGVTMPTLPNCPGSSLTAYSATPCKNNNFTLTSNQITTLCGPGVYFISGTLTLRGNSLIQTGSLTTTPPCPPNNPGTALFILLPGASLDTRGGGAINITGNPSVAASQVPTAFERYTEPSCQTTSPPSCLLNNMAIYDRGSDPVTIGGNSGIHFDGNMYLPNAAVTLQGNPTLDDSKCEKLIAGSLAFNGNATFNVSGCSQYTPPLTSQIVRLVQ